MPKAEKILVILETRTGGELERVSVKEAADGLDTSNRILAVLERWTLAPGDIIRIDYAADLETRTRF